MSKTTDHPSGSGIPQELAKLRSRIVRDLQIGLRLAVPVEPAAPMVGRICLRFSLADAVSWPTLDFRPAADDDGCRRAIGFVRINGREANFTVRAGHIVLTGRPESAGPHEIEIGFLAGSAGLTRRPDLAYSLFVPAHAHEVLPCFDQPDLKARLELELEVPAHWRALGNGACVACTDVDDRKIFRFAVTEPLPTYLFAFLAGRLDSGTGYDGDRELTLFHAPDTQPLVERNREEIFALHSLALRRLEAYTGIPYPFGKFAFALIPDFEFAGMEHPGAIFYRERLLLLSEDATAADRERRANLIAHETAHMWFGNLVTMRWFDDVWLKEVFANFMADKIVAERYPDKDHEAAFVLRHFPAALEIDRSDGTHAIRRPLDNLAEAGELYDALIYHKAPIAMATLERDIGSATLREALRDWLVTYRFGSSDWPELEACLQARSERALGDFSAQWVEAVGPPRLDSPAAGGERAVYGVPVLDERARAGALDRLQGGRRLLERCTSWIALFEDMLGGGISPAELLTAGIERLGAETDDLLIDRLLTDLGTVYWRFLTPGKRAVAAAPLELTLIRCRASVAADDGTLRWLARLARFAVTEPTLAELEETWRTRRIGATRLPESLELRLATTLALRRSDRAGEIIDIQLERSCKPERGAKLAFLAPALAAAKPVRDAFFGRLFMADARSLWKLAALELLNDASRAESALDYLVPGLEEAARIRARGEIFLPRQWLAALFSGHSSPEAAAIVRAYLDSHELPPRFRDLVLQTADLLFRAARLAV